MGTVHTSMLGVNVLWSCSNLTLSRTVSRMFDIFVNGNCAYNELVKMLAYRGGIILPTSRFDRALAGMAARCSSSSVLLFNHGRNCY